MRSVESPTWRDFYASVCRWYSKTFHTPLVSVYDLPQAFVMRTWYEERYEDLYNSTDKDKREEYAAVREQVLYAEEIAQQEQDDQEWEQQMAAEVKAGMSAHEEQQKQDLASNPLRIDPPNLIEESGNLLFDDTIPEI